MYFDNIFISKDKIKDKNLNFLYSKNHTLNEHEKKINHNKNKTLHQTFNENYRSVVEYKINTK